jgi:integrase
MRGQIRKRGKSWAVIVYLGRNPQTGQKRRKWYTHATKREAEAHLAQVLVQVQAGAGVPPSKLLLGDYLDRWLQDYARGMLAATTLRSYEETVRLHLAPALGDAPLARLSAPTIQAYLNQKLQHGLSVTTVRYHAAVLHVALRRAVRWGLLVRSPLEFVDLPRPRRKEMRVWDEEQVRLFLGEARKSSEYYALYLAAVTTGMRQGELLGLRWADIDFTLGIATIQQTFYRLGGEQLFRTPKTATSRRVVELSPALLNELQRARELQKAIRQKLKDAYEDHDLVFCQTNGRPLHAHNIVRRDFHLTGQRAKVPRIRFHDLRHCHATHLLRQGENLKVVQERLGHSTPAFTLSVYGHVLPGMQRDAARRLEARLLGKSAGS